MNFFDTPRRTQEISKYKKLDKRPKGDGRDKDVLNTLLTQKDLCKLQDSNVEAQV